VNTFTHQALRYSSPDELVATLVPLARIAIRRGEPVVIVLPAPLPDRLADHLGRDGAAVEFTDYADTYRSPAYTLAQLVRTLRDHATNGCRPTVVGSPLIGLRAGAEVLPWLHIESVFNTALADIPAHMVCSYPSDRLTATVETWVNQTHPELVRAGGDPVPSADYLPPPQFLAAYPAPPAAPLGPPSFELRFGAEPLGPIRRMLATRAADAGLSTDRAQDLILAVSEAMTNSVEHGAGTGVLRGWLNGQLTIEVHDAGTFLDDYWGLLPPAPTALRGRGLWLIRQLCDRAHIWSDSTGTTVRLTT